MLFIPPAQLGITTGEPTAPHRNPFPFSEKPNVLDRDRILVPIGWDSWGKIAVLRDGFDAKTWNEAWDNDIESDANTPEVKGSEPSARSLYADLVPDRGIKVACFRGLLERSTNINDSSSHNPSLHLMNQCLSKPF